MKLTPAQLEQYYKSQGIEEADLLSAEDVTLDELPHGTVLTDDERENVLCIVQQWNRMGTRTKVDAARAAERRALSGRDRDEWKTIFAWTAYLLLGRVRGCEERRETMRRIARGEVVAAPRKPRRSARKPAQVTEEDRAAAAAFTGRVHARLRAKGYSGVVHEATTETDAYGETVTSRPASSLQSRRVEVGIGAAIGRPSRR